MLGIRHDAGQRVRKSKTRLTEAVAHVAVARSLGFVVIGRATGPGRALIAEVGEGAFLEV